MYVPAGASDEPDPGGTEANACQTHNRHLPEPDRLTEAGKELQPILLAFKEWDDRHCNPGAEPVVFQHTCGADFYPQTVCAACRAALRDGDLTVTGGTHPVQATM